MYVTHQLIVKVEDQFSHYLETIYDILGLQEAQTIKPGTLFHKRNFIKSRRMIELLQFLLAIIFLFCTQQKHNIVRTQQKHTTLTNHSHHVYN